MAQALTVSAVVSFLREVLEANEFFSDLWIAGEVSSYSRSQAGHRYFSLRDPGGVLRSVLFRDSMPRLQLKDGDRVLSHGRLTIYPQRGDLQFVVDFVRPEGVGIMAARSDELRERLEREGLFDVSRKRPLPRFPSRIGLVTSPAGAALHDVRTVLERRWPLATMLFAPAMVQGDQAPGEIAAAIRALAREPGLDLAIVARGGGSAEDLSAFNSEAVARAIYAFPVPIISGVGHETDITIADMVADLRAPTPSAAAELATPDIADIERSVTRFDRLLRDRVHDGAVRAGTGIEAQFGRLERGLPQPTALGHRVSVLERGMAHASLTRAAEAGARLGRSEASLAALNPHATLARGFAIVQHAGKRKVVSSVRGVRAGDRLSIAVADGAFWSEVS